MEYLYNKLKFRKGERNGAMFLNSKFVYLFSVIVVWIYSLTST